MPVLGTLGEPNLARDGTVDGSSEVYIRGKLLFLLQLRNASALPTPKLH